MVALLMLIFIYKDNQLINNIEHLNDMVDAIYAVNITCLIGNLIFIKNNYIYLILSNNIDCYNYAYYIITLLPFSICLYIFNIYIFIFLYKYYKLYKTINDNNYINLYNFIYNKKSNIKKLFILYLISMILTSYSFSDLILFNYNYFLKKCIDSALYYYLINCANMLSLFYFYNCIKLCNLSIINYNSNISISNNI